MKPARRIAAAALWMVALPAAGQLPFNEDFESDGNGSRYTLSSQFFDLAAGIFDQTTNLSHAEDGTYSGQSGSGIFASEDTDDGAGSGADEQTIVFSIDVTGATGLMFDALFAAGDEAPASYDIDDHIFIDAQIDAGAVQRILCFESTSATLGSQPIAEDTDCLGGVGNGTTLGLAFQRFSAPITGTGTTLTLTIRIEADSSFESLAIDDINVTGAAGPTTVSSVNRVTASPSNASTVQWDINFANPVSGLAPANLVLVDVGGSIAGEGISTVVDQGAGTVWRVTANTGTGDGTLRLDVNNDSGLTPGLTNVPYTAGQTIVIDKSGPAINISAPSVASTASGPVSYTVTYTGATSVTLNNGDVTLNSTGTANGSVNVTGSGTTTRTVTVSSVTGDGTLGITIAAGTATDGANPAAAAGPSATFEVDNTGPTVAIGPPSYEKTAFGPISFEVTYTDADSVTLSDGDVTLNTVGTATGSVTVTGSGSATRTVTIDTISGDGMIGISLPSGTGIDALGNPADAAGPSAQFAVDNQDPGTIALLCEEFETDGNGSRYTLSSQFNGLPGDMIFDQTSDLTHAEDGTYNGQSGSGIFAAEDTDDNLGNGADEQTIVFSFSIAGQSDLAFYGLFAAGDEDPASYDNVDHIIVEAQIDADPLQTLLQFESTGTLNSVPIQEDTDFNGQGDGTTLGLHFQPFSAPISGTGNNLTLTVRIQADSGFESLALDLLKVTAVATGPPEIDVHDGPLITDPPIVNGGVAADFGTTSEAVGLIDREFNIDNTAGTGDLTINSIGFVGGDSGDFSVLGGTPTTIVGGASETFTVRFDPSAIGLRTTTMRISNDDSDEDPYDIMLSGSGDGPEPEMDFHDGPDLIARSIEDGGMAAGFGDAIVNGGGVERSFNIDNTAGTSDLNIFSIDFTGTNPGDFSVVSAIPSVVGPGSSDLIRLRFNPSGLGSRSATMQIVNNDADEGPYDVQLSGTGITGNLLLCEDFEDDGNGSRYTLSSQFFDLVEGIFDQTTDLSHAQDGTYTGQSGSGIFASEDTDDTTNGGNGNDEQTITFSVPIAGEFGLGFSGLFAAGDEAPASYQNHDYIIVEAQVDAQPVQTLLQFESLGNLNSVPMHHDTDFDGEGDGVALGLAFQEFDAPISGTGTTLTLTIRINAESGFRSLAVDLLKVSGFVAAPLAGPLVVTTDTDEDDGIPDPLAGTGTSLREAIQAANLAPGADDVNFSNGSGGTINFFDPSAETIAISALGQLEITDDLTVNGPGSNRVTIDGGNTVRGLDLTAANVDLSGLTIKDGEAGPVEDGGGIRITAPPAATINIDDVSVQDSNARGGGGIHLFSSSGTITISNSKVSNNSRTLNGGGINILTTDATVTIANSSIDGNGLTGGQHGGGVFFDATGPAALIVRDSTVSGNDTLTYGGGMYLAGAIANKFILNSTVSGNGPNPILGAGIYALNGTNVITNSTITGNVGMNFGGGVRNLSGTTTVSNSIIAGNSTPGTGPDVLGTFASNGFNFIGDTGGSGGFTSDKTFASTGTTITDVLDPILTNKNGPTFVHLLVPGSPAINMGNNADAIDESSSPLLNDQRGVARIGEGTVDIGAVESVPPIVVTNTDNSGAGSLRQAISDAINGGAINFDPGLDGGTITLSSSLNVSKEVSINASDLADGITISGNNSVRVFTISGAPVVLESLTIADGNFSVGGGIFTTGTLSLIDSTVTRNNASSLGGGIYNSGGTLHVLRSTFTENSAPTGGAIRNIVGSMTLTNSTITGNSAQTGGGVNSTVATFEIVHSTITGNSATSSAGGLNLSSGSGSLENSIVADNTAPSSNDIGGSFSTLTLVGNNLIGENDGFYAGVLPFDGFLIGNSSNPVEAHLAPLSHYGGKTETNHPLAISTALENAVASGNTPATDQRGFSRTVGVSDLGAVEGGPVITVGSANDAGGQSLREAIADAAGNATTHISFGSGAFPGTINLSSQLDIAGLNIFIDGSEIANPGVTISGQNSTRIFSISGSSIVGLECLTLRDGNAADGGAVRVEGSSLTIDRSSLTDNISSNDGAGVFAFGESRVDLHSSFIRDNTATGFGGGIMSLTDTISAVNTTFTRNQANDGSSIWIQGSGSLTLNQATISDNTSTVGFSVVSFVNATVENSVVADNSPNDYFESGTSNLLGNNLIGGDPMLAMASNFGGRTDSMVVLPGSPVIEGGILSVRTPVRDQRDADRPTGAQPDLGAVEAFGLLNPPNKIDFDLDGIDDRIETAIFGNTTTAGLTSNRDGDRSSDLEEIANMTNPNDPLHNLRFLSFTPAAGFDPATNPVFDVTVLTFPGFFYDLDIGPDIDNLTPQFSFEADSLTADFQLTLPSGSGYAQAVRK